MKAMEYKDYLQRFLDKLGIKALNEMQQEAYKAIKDTSKDIVILSPTGTGKTLAYLLPILEKIDLSSDSVQVIVVVPSRELAIQTTDILKRALYQVRAYACYGGRATMDEHREINKLKPQIIFGTPGRLNDHIDKHNFEIDNVKTLVIDEFDKCLKVGFRKEMTILVDSLPFVRRRILLSATNSPDLYLFARKNNTQEVLFLDEDNQPTDRIEPYYITSTSKDKLETLSTLLKTLGNESSIVFLNHRESVDRVYEYLSKEGFCVSALHGGFGIAIPYGNSTVLPFEKRYFSGGANSVRGWSVRELGPGKFKGVDGRIDFINQTGDMKLDLNAEYRTHLFWKLDAAAFIDAGNIWTLRDYADQPGGQFSFKSFYNQIAVAYGLGLRLNFDYFILRFDGGMKAINPAYTSTEEHYALWHPNLKRDFTFHFAVGLPF